MATRKTTLMLDDALIADFKIRAAKAGKSLSNMVAEAMRTYDANVAAKPRPERWEIKVLGSGQPLADIDWSSNAAVRDYLEEDLPVDKQR